MGSGAQRHQPAHHRSPLRLPPGTPGPAAEPRAFQERRQQRGCRGEEGLAARLRPAPSHPGGRAATAFPSPHHGGGRAPEGRGSQGRAQGGKRRLSPPTVGAAAPGSRGPRAAAGLGRSGQPRGEVRPPRRGQGPPGPTCVHGGPAEAAAAADCTPGAAPRDCWRDAPLPANASAARSRPPRPLAAAGFVTARRHADRELPCCRTERQSGPQGGSGPAVGLEGGAECKGSAPCPERRRARPVTRIPRNDVLNGRRHRAVRRRPSPAPLFPVRVTPSTMPAPLGDAFQGSAATDREARREADAQLRRRGKREAQGASSPFPTFPAPYSCTPTKMAAAMRRPPCCAVQKPLPHRRGAPG